MNAIGIHQFAHADPARLAFVHAGGRMTYGELEVAVNRAAHAFADAGIGPGDRVAVLVGNRPEYFVYLNALSRLGAFLVPIGGRLTAPEVRYIVEDSGAKLFVTDRPKDAAALSEVDPESLWQIDDVRLHDGGAGRDEPPTRDYLGLMQVAMQYTSGTTGRPKGVARNVPQPMPEPQPSMAALVFGYDADGVHLVCGPLYHAAPGGHGQMNLWAGAAVVLQERFDATVALETIQREGVTSAFMAPAHFIRLLEADWQGYDRSSMTRLWHAGAPCPPPVKRQIFEVFPDAVWEFYGMSEGMGGIVSPEEWQARPGTVGKAFPGLEYRILDEDGNALPNGEIGLIYVSAIPGNEFAYHGDAAKTKAAWRDGFYTVGDMGRLDDDGYLYLADRRTDLILRNGVNIYPAEIEHALLEHPDVIDAAAFGLPDDRTGQKVHAIVELRASHATTPEAITEFLRSRLADFKVPAIIEVVAELPREPNGKIFKRRLREERMRSTDS